jgi:hypothetical protein
MPQLKRRSANTETDRLVTLIQRRHEGPGWQVFTELANGTGSRARRRADAVAMGMWPSRGYEVHGYEIKVSRGDVRKELTDVGKADSVGKYCDFWWLAVSDTAIIDGLLIPSAWGILAPKDRVLRSVRAATKCRAAPLDRAFVAAMLRSVTKHWVPRQKMRELEKNREAEIARAVQHEREHGADDDKRALEQLRRNVKAFEDASGIQIQNGWRHAEVGKAVEVVLQLMETANLRIEQRALDMERTANLYRDHAKQAAQGATALRAMMADLTDLVPKKPVSEE